MIKKNYILHVLPYEHGNHDKLTPQFLYFTILVPAYLAIILLKFMYHFSKDGTVNFLTISFFCPFTFLAILFFAFSLFFHEDRNFVDPLVPFGLKISHSRKRVALMHSKQCALCTDGYLVF